MITTPESSDVTVIRASYLGASYLAPEEASLKNLWTEESEEEEEEEEEEDEDEDEENSGQGRLIMVGNLRIREYIESEPEWDVDSYDGREYITDSETKEAFSDEEEYQRYRARKCDFFESKGFLPDYQNGIWDVGDLDYLQPGGTLTYRKLLTNLALLCIEKLNKEKGKTVELDSIVRATLSGGGSMKFRITIMVREYPDGPLVEYQAKVMKYAGNHKPPFPIFCRPAPKPNLKL